MRIFMSFKDMLNETIRELFSRGRTVFDRTVQGKDVSDRKEEFEQKELIGYLFTVVIQDPNKLEQDLKEMMDFARKVFGKDWLTAEVGERWFQEIISYTFPETWYKGTGLEEYWKEFGIEKDGRFAYTYGERLSAAIPQLIHCLKRNKYMRGAVITVYETCRDLTNVGKRRTPCTMYVQVLIRPEAGEDVLTGIVTFRSQDLATFFPLDVYKSARLFQYIAEQVGVRFKYYIHFTGSLHCYRRDAPRERQW